MIEQILDYIHNYFVKKVHSGTFTIANGSLSGVDFLLGGQYFKITGSVLNDGIYQYPVNDLSDEVFDGEIWAMAVPPAVITLSNEISDWVSTYGDVMKSPYTSESFGGYTYSKAQGSSGGSALSSWQAVFATRLNTWRKIS